MAQEEVKDLAAIVKKWHLAEEGEQPFLSLLGGGVSNSVAKVQTSRGTWVLKRALPQLRVSDTWLADPFRIAKEASCLRVLRKYVGPDVAPNALETDMDNFACLIECAPEGSRTWKADLLDGKVDGGITERVARTMRRFHEQTRGRNEIESEFRDQSNFVQLRVDPYLRTVANRHPDIKEQINETITSLLTRRICLVHGDYSPKNILVLPSGAVWLIDCEVAHYGNPNFDIAFCTNHLILKALHLRSEAHLHEAARLWSLYWSNSEWTEIEPEAVRTLSSLMLARVDGKSPVEYFNDDDSILVRRIAKHHIRGRTDRFSEIHEAIYELAKITQFDK